MTAEPHDPGERIEPLSEAARTRIRNGIERKLAAGFTPAAPRDPVRALISPLHGVKIAAGLAVATIGVAVAATVTVGTPPHSSGPTRGAPPLPPAAHRVPGVAPSEPPPQDPPLPPSSPSAVTESPGPPAAPAPARQRRARPSRSTPRREAHASSNDERGAQKPALALSAEVALLDRARRALKAGAPQDALVAVRAHARSFPDGVLAPERETIRITALCALGRLDEARRRGRRFLARYPHSPLAPTVRASCATAAGDEP